MSSGGGHNERSGSAGPRLLACLAALAALLVLPVAAEAGPKWELRTLAPQSTAGGGPDYPIVLYAVSCPSESLCLATGPFDTIAYSRDPTGDAGTWRVVNPVNAEPNQKCVEEGWGGDCRRPRGTIVAISCAGESLCVAVGYEGSVFASTDPTGGAAAWSVSDVNAPGGASHLTGVSCPSPSLCVAVSGGYGDAAGQIFTSTTPAGGGWRATRLAGSPDLRGVSCATPTTCVAVGKDGGIFASGDPTGGAAAWRRAGSPTPRDLFAVSCVASLLCAAGDAGGNVLTSTDPLGGGFDAVNADGSVQITGASCPTPQRCLAVTNNADVLTSTSPTGGGGAWTFENLVPFETEGTGGSTFVKNALFGASCASTSLCVLVGANSRIFTSTDPFTKPAPAPAGSGKRKRLRPRTILVFAEDFWKSRATRQRHVKARFRFYSRDGARGFLCKPDRRRWRPCHSPLRYWVGIGHHVLRVRAIGPTGLHGPATRLRFVVSRPSHRVAQDRGRRAAAGNVGGAHGEHGPAGEDDAAA